MLKYLVLALTLTVTPVTANTFCNQQADFAEQVAIANSIGVPKQSIMLIVEQNLKQDKYYDLYVIIVDSIYNGNINPEIAKATVYSACMRSTT